ncbi:hypothetical protein K6W36_09625 [Acetobacter senegalensis]|uniref:hypothetical protein n=1 Tax=Acetobacter senegalensis TaxID=446692 RepID=UPI001EDACFAA|nr:hypothetical protein [Acetobacter senegalensis]MCG4260843.1 hypothetical protein [Acetobacter senegalensis]
MPREVYQPETIVSMTVADDEAEAQFGSLMKAVRREKNFDPSLPLTITVEQKPVGYAKSLERVLSRILENSGFTGRQGFRD